MNGALAVVRYSLIELSRRRILLVFFAVGAAGIVLIATLLKVFATALTGNIGSGSSDSNVDPATLGRALQLGFVSDIISALGIFALLIAFGIGMTVIYHDLESGAAISIFSKPVSRAAYAGGKVAAAIVAMVAIVGVLSLEARLVMFLFGTGDLGTALWWETVAQVANAVTLMLLVMALSTWMNNIIAAVVAFIYNAVGGIVVALHTQEHAGGLGNNAVLKAGLDLLYWLVPHQLISDAPREIAKAELALVAASSQGGGPTADQVLSSIPLASSATDIIWWAFGIAVFAALVYMAVRRKQV